MKTAYSHTHSTGSSFARDTRIQANSAPDTLIKAHTHAKMKHTSSTCKLE